MSLILTLSHGNADVERGAQRDSVSEHSLRGKRQVKDYMYSNGLKPHTVIITQTLQKFCAQTRGRYRESRRGERKEAED